MGPRLEHASVMEGVRHPGLIFFLGLVATGAALWVLLSKVKGRSTG